MLAATVASNSLGAEGPARTRMISPSFHRLHVVGGQGAQLHIPCSLRAVWTRCPGFMLGSHRLSVLLGPPCGRHQPGALRAARGARRGHVPEPTAAQRGRLSGHCHLSVLGRPRVKIKWEEDMIGKEIRVRQQRGSPGEMSLKDG